MPRKPMKDVIVLLPGIIGSVLAKDGKDVWAITPGAAVRALFSLGRSIKDLELAKDPPDVDDLGDGVTAPRVVPDIHFIPGLWKIDGYSKIAKAIQAGFDVQPGQNYFEFAYDWRRDNRVAARQLSRQSHDWLKAWKERSGNDEAKLILVGHSMGGLVSRYFLECMEGWKSTRMLVTFGTPYRGSLNALGFIANGMEKKIGPFTVADLSGLLRSFTSVYQLLPVYPCFQGPGGKLVRISEASIPNVDLDRAEDARDFHEEIRKAVEENEKNDLYRRDRYLIRPVVGTFQPTLQSARPAGTDAVDLLRDYKGEDQDGDGTVPKVSATPLELGNNPSAMYASERHASLQNFDAVIQQLDGVLSGLDLDLSMYYAMNIRVSLDVDDAFLTDEHIIVRVRPEDPAVALVATLLDERNQVVARKDLSPGDDEWREVRFEPLPAGAYRVTVRGEFGVDPVTDVFGVFSSEGEQE